MGKQGVFPKTGKWEPGHVAQLEKNMKDYLKYYLSKDISHLNFPQTKEEKKFSSQNKGRWTAEEDDSLIKAVNEFRETKRQFHGGLLQTLSVLDHENVAITGGKERPYRTR